MALVFSSARTRLKTSAATAALCRTPESAKSSGRFLLILPLGVEARAASFEQGRRSRSAGRKCGALESAERECIGHL